MGPLTLFEVQEPPAVAKVAPHGPQIVAMGWRDHQDPPDRAGSHWPVDVTREGVAGVRSG